MCRELIELEIQKEETKIEEEPNKGKEFMAQIEADDPKKKELDIPLVHNSRIDTVEGDDEVVEDVDSCHVSYLHFFEIKTKGTLDVSGKNNYQF